MFLTQGFPLTVILRTALYYSLHLLLKKMNARKFPSAQIFLSCPQDVILRAIFIYKDLYAAWI